MKNKKENKRKNNRQDCHVPVEGKIGPYSGYFQAVDIGKGGMGLISAHSIPLKQKVVVELALNPEDEPLLVIGQVKWIQREKRGQRFRLGMKFINNLVPDGKKNRLNYFFSE